MSRISELYYNAVELSTVVSQLTKIIMSKDTPQFMQPEQIKTLNSCYYQLFAEHFSTIYGLIGTAYSLAADHCRGIADNADQIVKKLQLASTLCQSELARYKKAIIDMVEAL